MKIKDMSVAGVFYPASKNDIENFFKNCDKSLLKNEKYGSRMIIVPHAGYEYSGEIAFKGYSYLDENVKNLFIIAPAHYEKIYGCVVSDYTAFETPFGLLPVNEELNTSFKNLCECEVCNQAFENEHSIEVQLPFIKYFLPDVNIIPILYGCENFKNITAAISKFYSNPENAFVVSSDLSHFYPAREAEKIDNYTAQMIERGQTGNFEAEQACGAVGICAAVDFAREKNYTFIRVGLTNSAPVNQDTSKVVGYGSWFLYEGAKNEYIQKYYSELLVKIARESIRSGLQLGCVSPEYPCVLEENGACFVTLKLNNKLRGCVGSVMASRPLITELLKNSHSAAFADSRFSPLTIDEFKDVKLEISLLSAPTRLEFSNEDELLSRLRPGVDGLFIRSGQYSSVFLPTVWKMLPDKHEFLEALKQKAGMLAQGVVESAFTFSAVEIFEK